MAPPGRVRALWSEIEDALADQVAAPTPRGGLGGGFRLHQGRRRPPTKLEPESSYRRPPTPEQRAPLYVSPRAVRADAAHTLESVMERRAQMQHRGNAADEEAMQRLRWQQQQQQQQRQR